MSGEDLDTSTVTAVRKYGEGTPANVQKYTLCRGGLARVSRRVHMHNPAESVSLLADQLALALE